MKEIFKQDKYLNFDIGYWAKKDYKEFRTFVIQLQDRKEKIDQEKEAKKLGAKKIYDKDRIRWY